MAGEDDHRKQIALTSRRSLCFKVKAPNSEPLEDEVLGFVCPVCDKRFKSGKALGGHKRMHSMKKTDEEEEEVCTEWSKKSLSHPERGIQAPPPPALGWSVTGRRSESSSSSIVLVVPGMDDDFKEAVLDLMLLAHYKPKEEKKKRYVCTACDKSFASYQALGGHRSSHNKSHSHLHNYQNTYNFDLNDPPPPPPDQDQF